MPKVEDSEASVMTLVDDVTIYTARFAVPDGPMAWLVTTTTGERLRVFTSGAMAGDFEEIDAEVTS